MNTARLISTAVQCPDAAYYRLVPGVWTESVSYYILLVGFHSTGVTTTEGAERSAGP